MMRIGTLVKQACLPNKNWFYLYPSIIENHFNDSSHWNVVWDSSEVGLIIDILKGKDEYDTYVRLLVPSGTGWCCTTMCEEAFSCS